MEPGPPQEPAGDGGAAGETRDSEKLPAGPEDAPAAQPPPFSLSNTPGQPPSVPAWTPPPPPQPQPGWAAPPGAAPQGQWPPPPAGWPPPPPQGPWQAVPGYPYGPPPPAWGWQPAWYPPAPGRGPYPGWVAGGVQVSGSGRFRPQSIPELIDSGFTLYRRNFLLIVAIAAAIQIPFAVFNVLLTHGFDLGGRLRRMQDLANQISLQGYQTQAQHDQLTSDLGALVLFYMVPLVVGFLIVAPLSQAATVRAVSDRYLDRTASVAGSLGAAVRRLRPLLAMLGLQILVFGGGIALLVVLLLTLGSSSFGLVALLAIAAFFPAVLLAVRWSLAPQAIVVEGTSGYRGLARSWELTKARFWRTFWLRVLLGLLTAIVSGVLAYLASLPATTAGPDTQQSVTQVVSAAVAVFIAPLTLITVTLYYYDQRIRREAFDLEMLAASL